MTPRRLRARQPRLTPVLRAACHAILIGYDVAPGLVDMSEFVDLVDKGFRQMDRNSHWNDRNSHWRDKNCSYGERNSR